MAEVEHFITGVCKDLLSRGAYLPTLRPQNYRDIQKGCGGGVVYIYIYIYIQKT